ARRRGVRRRAVPLSRRALVLALVSAVVVAAAAVAATTGLLSTGEPLKNPAGVGFSPSRGEGVPIASSVRLSPVRVADPAGGPSWGLRTLKTTRGLGCVQLGRIYDGRLGVLGQDGAFAGDGRFHERPPGVLSPFDCQTPDAVGHTFLAGVLHGLPASGLMEGCDHVRRSGPNACPAQDLRIVFYGVLGPRATAVTYRDEAGRVRVQRTVGPDGAYLVVLRPSAAHPAGTALGFTPSPATGLRSVRYRGAPECRIASPKRRGGAKRCPLVGFVHRAAPQVTAAQVLSPVRAHVSRKVRAQVPPARLHLPTAHVRRVTAVFRARVAAHGAGAGYVTWFVVHGCRNAYGTIAPTDRDIAAGEVVAVHADVPAECHGRVTGTVSYHQAGAEPGNGPPGLMFTGKGPTVGTFSARLP
ncbi:MAG: hypothetical protein JWQ18_1926, partial [Conexibacter sp.]|nr:hypothetical protein [Conexibacter sp.]